MKAKTVISKFELPDFLIKTGFLEVPLVIMKKQMCLSTHLFLRCAAVSLKYFLTLASFAIHEEANEVAAFLLLTTISNATEARKKTF